jgi:hypothetical protein
MALSQRTPTRPVLTAARARQGRFGQHVFWVLVFGTLLAALGLFAAWGWRSPDLANSNTNNPRATSGGPPAYAPEPAARQAEPAPGDPRPDAAAVGPR